MDIILPPERRPNIEAETRHIKYREYTASLSGLFSEHKMLNLFYVFVLFIVRNSR
jgi:hypothetical protein